MTKLTYSFIHRIRPIAPYNFELTVRKPAGWSLFTPFEVYEHGVLWTATHLDGALAGIMLSSSGTTEKPNVIAKVFLKDKPAESRRDEISRLLDRELGADENLGEFYRMAGKDRILKHTVEDRYGMHNTFSNTIFDDAVLSILLQMAPLKRSNEMMNCFISKYGDAAEFEGKSIRAWPLPGRVAKATASEMASGCKLGYRAKRISELARKIEREGFPTTEEIERISPEKAKELLLELPGIGDYSADIINPHGGFPIDVWSVEVFAKLFYGREPRNNREDVEKVKREGLRRWGKWAWMAFFYTVQDLENLSRKMGISLRIE